MTQANFGCGRHGSDGSQPSAQHYHVVIQSQFSIARKKTEDVIASHPDKKFVPSYNIASFVNSIEKPRRIMLMVQAGPGTDATIQNLLPHLDKGDILIDGGNTFYKDTERRNAELANSGINFIGYGCFRW